MAKELLSSIRENEANPRTITEVKVNKLVNSLLTFPKMLSLRPIVLDVDKTILGGNMRYKALTILADLSENELISRLNECPEYKKFSKKKQKELEDFWRLWTDKKEVEVLHASQLSDAEKQEFIIKDNVAFGNWDWDMLANEWDLEDLQNFGLDCSFLDESWDNLPDIEGDVKEPSLDKPIKIEIVIPFRFKNIENEVRSVVKDTLKDYESIEIK